MYKENKIKNFQNNFINLRNSTKIITLETSLSSSSPGKINYKPIVRSNNVSIEKYEKTKNLEILKISGSYANLYSKIKNNRLSSNSKSRMKDYFMNPLESNCHKLKTITIDNEVKQGNSIVLDTSRTIRSHNKIIKVKPANPISVNKYLNEFLEISPQLTEIESKVKENEKIKNKLKKIKPVENLYKMSESFSILSKTSQKQIIYDYINEKIAEIGKSESNIKYNNLNSQTNIYSFPSSHQICKQITNNYFEIIEDSHSGNLIQNKLLIQKLKELDINSITDFEKFYSKISNSSFNGKEYVDFRLNHKFSELEYSKEENLEFLKKDIEYNSKEFMEINYNISNKNRKFWEIDNLRDNFNRHYNILVNLKNCLKNLEFVSEIKNDIKFENLISKFNILNKELNMLILPHTVKIGEFEIENMSLEIFSDRNIIDDYSMADFSNIIKNENINPQFTNFLFTDYDNDNKQNTSVTNCNTQTYNFNNQIENFATFKNIDEEILLKDTNQVLNDLNSKLIFLIRLDKTNKNSEEISPSNKSKKRDLKLDSLCIIIN